jgi:hypothetical protein
VLEGQTGHVHADGDIDAMAHLFAGLADDRPRALRMGDAARALVAHYTPAAAGDGVMRAVSGAVRGGASQ